jgi:hypothetical protein
MIYSCSQSKLAYRPMPSLFLTPSAYYTYSSSSWLDNSSESLSQYIKALIHLLLEEVSVHAGYEVLMEVDDISALIVGDP